MSFKFTKIVTTIGPSSNSYDILKQLIQNGANVVRLNFSHGSFEDHAKVVDTVRRIEKELGVYIAILQDLQGPKIRVGHLAEEAVQLVEGQEFTITTEEMVGKGNKVSIDYPYLHEEAAAGDRILLDDGLLELRVESVRGKDIITRVLTGGALKQRKGVNLPDNHLKHIRSVTEKDAKDLAFAFEQNLDFVAMSFVRTADDVNYLRDIMQDTYGRTIPIVSKIEKPEAVQSIDAIIEVTDVIMVARGDLGVETSTEEVPVAQKVIIRKCQMHGTPVITATQMLDSMIVNPRPTRAEATDVANAILDRTSAIMLSGESASGKHPVAAVSTMREIATYFESSAYFKDILLEDKRFESHWQEGLMKDPYAALAFSAANLARYSNAKAIIAGSESGRTIAMLSKYRPHVPIFACGTDVTVVRRFAIYWGVQPVLLEDIQDESKMLAEIAKVPEFQNLVQVGDHVVILSSDVVGGDVRRTNSIKLHELY